MTPDQLLLFAPEAAPSFGHELSPEQAQVRDAGAGHRIVIAGAGTGKTELLTQRVLKLLLVGAPQDGIAPANLEGVVALTFTNKAAGEMRSRVYRALVGRLRQTSDAAERARLSELRAHFSARNRIWTFDSLGATLLRLFPEHSPLPRGAKLPTAGQERALMRDLSRRFWAYADTFDEAQQERLFELLELFERRENALGAIRDAARRDASTLEALAQERPFGEFAAHLLDLAQRRLDALWAIHVREVELLPLAPRARALLLDRSAVFSPSKSGGFLTTKGFAAPFARELEGVVCARDQKRLASRLLEWKNASLEVLERRQSFEAGEEEPAGEWEREWRGRRAVASLARYALWWQGAERALKDERALASFDDITRAALRVLEVPEVQDALRGEIAWLLVDEFQDTNPSQWRLVQGLRRHAPYQRGNTLLVGDPKQAIYDFRGGDIRVFDEGRETLEREGALVSPLSISRRSAPPLVAWTNRAFSAIFPGEGAPRERFEAPHGPLSSVREAWATPRAPGDQPGVYILRPPQWRASDAPQPEKMLTEALRMEAAGALASWLLELLADAKALETGGEARQPWFSSVAEAMAQGEPAVAVLFSDNSVKTLFEGVLRERGVPFSSVRGRGFFRCDAVRWSVWLWRVLLDEDDEAAWVGLLRSPLGGQSDVSLLERHVARAVGQSEWTPSNPLDGATQAALLERLATWRQLAGVWPVSRVMEQVLEESEVAFFEAACEDAPQREENWRKVLELVRAREDEDEGGLRALVDFFEAHADDDAEPLAPLPAGGAIQLMTVHAAKGLGFACCVLAQLESAKREGGDKTVLWGEVDGQEVAAFGFGREREDEAQGRDKAAPPLLFELLHSDAGARALAEWKRLFYVACTRAQSHLVLLETNGNAPETSWHALARDTFAGLEEVRPCAQALLPTVPLATASPEEKSAPAPLPPAPLPADAPHEVAFDALWGEGAALPLAAQRAWLEARLRERGADLALLHQDVPFSAPAAAFGAHIGSEGRGEWIIGVWPWLAPLPGTGVLVAATGSTRAGAHERTRALALIARDAGLLVEEAFALWDEGGTVVGEALRAFGPTAS